MTAALARPYTALVVAVVLVLTGPTLVLVLLARVEQD